MEGNESGKNVKSAFGANGGDMPDWPIAVPKNVGIFGAQVPGEAEATPGSMTIVLDFDEVPGLAQVIDAHGKGRQFDIETRWAISEPPQSDSPLAILSAYFSEVDLGLHVAIHVDQYSEALLAAARTQWVTIVDDETYARLRSENPFKVFEDGNSIAFGVADNEPLLLVLMQRTDVQPKAQQAQPDASGDAQVSDGDGVEFLDGARPARVNALYMPPEEPPAIVLVDPTVASLRSQLDPSSDLIGDWAVLKTADGALARLDCKLDGERIAAWFVADPPQELVRMTASGAHTVAVVADPIRPDDEDSTASFLRTGVPIAVNSAREAMLPIMDSTPPD